MGGIRPTILWRACVIRVRGPNNVGRAVQTDPTLLGYGSVITKQKHPTICSKVCKGAQDVTSKIVASVCTGLKKYIYIYFFLCVLFVLIQLVDNYVAWPASTIPANCRPVLNISCNFFTNSNKNVVSCKL